MYIPTFGLLSLSKALDNAAKAVELQSTKLVIESVVDLRDYQAEKKITAKDIEGAIKLTNIINDSDLF